MKIGSKVPLYQGAVTIKKIAAKSYVAWITGNYNKRGYGSSFTEATNALLQKHPKDVQAAVAAKKK